MNIYLYKQPSLQAHLPVLSQGSERNFISVLCCVAEVLYFFSLFRAFLFFFLNKSLVQFSHLPCHKSVQNETGMLFYFLTMILFYCALMMVPVS